MRASRLLVALLVAVSLAAAACNGNGSPAGGPDKGGNGGKVTYANGGTFTIAVANDPGNLDPLMTVLSVTRAVSHLGYDTLINQTKNGDFVSGLAKSWRTDGNKIVFTMTKGVTCSDGSRLTPQLVADNIDFVGNPKNQSPLLGTILPPGIKATADDEAGTVTVTTPKPDGFLLNDMSGMFVVCGAGMRDRAKLAGHTNGTGPWVLTEAVPDDHYTYKRRQGYRWGPHGAGMTGPGVPDKVVVRVITNPTTMANLILSGEVNFGTVVGPDRKRLDQAGLSVIETRSPLGETFFNQAPGRPGADRAVREALTTATDIPQAMKVATAGSGKPSTGLITLEPKPCPGNTVAGSLPGYDPGRARQILDAAGWRTGPGGVRTKGGKKLAFTFIYPAGQGQSVVAGAELLAKQWQAVGAQVKLRSVTSTQLNQVIFSSGDWDASWTPITVSLPTQLVAFLSGPTPPKGTNFAHLQNSAYTGGVTAATAQRGSAACAKWNGAERALFKNFDVVPMFDSTSPTFLQHAQAAIVSGEFQGTSLRLLAD